MPLKDEIVQERLQDLSAFSILYMLLFVLGLCQGSCNTSVKPGFGKCLWGCGLSSGVPPPSLLPLTSDSCRKEQIRGLNCDSTLAIFTLSRDVSGCLEYQQVGMAVVFLCGCFVALSASQTHVGIGKWNKA